MEPLSIRDREIIVKHKQVGKSGYEIAQWLMIHRQTVSRVWQQFLTTGKWCPSLKTVEENQKSPRKSWKKFSQK